MRSCATAIKELLGYHKQGYKFVLDADIKEFFDSISQKLIMAIVSSRISDGKTLNTIKKFLQAGVMEEGNRFIPTRKGVPQGGNISPLISNIVLNHLDWTLDKQGYKFVRYADDFVVVTKTRKAAEEAHKVVKHCIEEDLGLKLSPEKTIITDFRHGFDFLGFRIKSQSVKMRPKAVRKFKDKIRELTIRKHNLSKDAIERVNKVIRGTVNYFYQDFTTSFTLFVGFDRWIGLINH